jgi:FkbM family methyltransferase
MKKYALGIANNLLRPFALKLERKTEYCNNNIFKMDLMIERFAQRDIPIQSVVDIGASDGKWSVAAMRHLPDTSFLAIEPLEERKENLLATKKKLKNFDFSLCAAGDIDGDVVQLNVTEDLDGSTVGGNNPGSPRKCIVRTVDSLIKEKKLFGPYLLKFDTHGYELPILSGCKQILSDTSAIIMETYNFQLTPTSLRFHEMCTHLEELGFRPVDIADPMLRAYDRAFWQIDILFVKKESITFKYPHYQ